MGVSGFIQRIFLPCQNNHNNAKTWKRIPYKEPEARLRLTAHHFDRSKLGTKRNFI